MKNFSENKDEINRELTQFIRTLNEVLPRYSLLLKKNDINSIELKELGELEHFLIEINAKITEIKNMLEHDLFGHSIDYYYQIKTKADKGDLEAKSKLDRLREAFTESLKGDTLINWN
ncbi:MAG: hypothetical protein KJ941_01415 [Bacteroidetes bacterium]|nr:hypothetical protein [Bacteroidota bacterium]